MSVFLAKHKEKAQGILVAKNMGVRELMDALTCALDLPDGQIVGFRD
jgi:hypothetical protein